MTVFEMLKSCFGFQYENWIVITAFGIFDAGESKGKENSSYFA